MKLRNNPLKEARTHLGLTQSEIARLADITPGAVIKNEQGLYPEPSAKILATLTYQVTGDPQDHYYDVLLASYKEWRMEKLTAAIPVFRFNKSVSGLHPSGGVNPFMCWRVNHLHISARIEFCKLLVLHPAVVQKYEQGEMRSMPESIWDTLIYVGMEKDSLQYLETLGTRFYDSHHSRSA